MKLEYLIDQAAGQPKKTVAVAVAEDHEVIEAVAKAIKLQLAQFRLYGNQEKIMGMLQEHGLQTSEHVEVIAAMSNAEAAELSVKAVRNGEADVLMKGNIPTANILKAVLNKEWGLRKGSVLSHVAAFEVPNYDRLIFVTDAAMNIAPDVTQKAAIIQNTVEVAQAIGIDLPKVAPIAAVEVVNPAMQATIDAAMLTQMNRRGQIKDCIVDGPLALDNAVSQIAAEHKGIVSDVAGKADILLVPTIEAGNVLYKSLVYFADAKVGAMIAGAKAPIVLTSRADSAETKVYSLALAVATASK
ncbi:phosphate butyryltransferase [Bacillus thuringiensis]|uniref:Phosphate butyryltransferase n=6 Tax=Bacillus cereus group TaxID=86661 RepID=A0A9X6XRS9_BACTU|nr:MULTISPECIES: phosphate butyryltransferase [Bacillus]EAO54677.1 Phosphate butyryltransferase [Bacillus thuringiensis serovar israelensis ATCC 35646]MED1154047.1 phosphate butyryltransferase [Bacillus paranthracis]ACK96802.1 phosphate butyryltransferase [Bacillus cereus G9842]AFQ28000.1 phosphate butyryltransferase [Bacillus thuringiensis HD-789]AJH07878.1 phosphate butyryltransferase [Bacillus thuringiensis HD1002]